MKQIKILSLILALVMLFAFTACAAEEPKKTVAQTAETAAETVAETAGEPIVETQESEELCYVTILSEDGENSFDVAMVGKSMLDAMKSDEYKDDFEADLTEGEFVMVNALKGLTPDTSKNEYIAIFTTDADPQASDVQGQYVKPVELDGVTYYYSNLGVADLTLKADMNYLFQIASY